MDNEEALLKEIRDNKEALLIEIRDTLKELLNFFYTIEERTLTESDSQNYLDELKKDNFHPPLG